MKFSTALFFAAVSIFGVTANKFIVLLPSDTPQPYIDDVEKALRDSGCKITHSYSKHLATRLVCETGDGGADATCAALIKGFAVESSDEAIENFQVSTQDAKYKPTIEDDQIVPLPAGVGDFFRSSEG